jgi:hypothetical protein
MNGGSLGEDDEEHDGLKFEPEDFWSKGPKPSKHFRKLLDSAKLMMGLHHDEDTFCSNFETMVKYLQSALEMSSNLELLYSHFVLLHKDVKEIVRLAPLRRKEEAEVKKNMPAMF